LPDSADYQQQPNSSPETDASASESPDPGAADSPEKAPATPISAKIPLPDFSEDQMDYNRPERSSDDSPPASPELDDSTVGPESENSPKTEGEQRQRVYVISSAEPDWSDFTLLPVDDLPPEEDPGSGWKTAWAVVREVGETILLTLIIFFLIQTVIRNFRVVGTSMVDNLHDGQYLIIDKLSYNEIVTGTFGLGGPKRGDVIVFEPPNRPGEDYVKRIIGLPGETVEIVKGRIMIDGEALAEAFQPRSGTYSMPPQVVPPDSVFVLGDNRNNSNDSHNWGALPLENIVGRAWISYWPPELWGTIPRDEPTETATLKSFLDELVPSANAESD